MERFHTQDSIKNLMHQHLLKQVITEMVELNVPELLTKPGDEDSAVLPR